MGRPEEGVCNNPRSYYFDTMMYADDEPEECGRKCKSCPHFLTDYELERW